MAIFELTCENCGAKMEVMCSHSKIKELVCEKCKKKGTMKNKPSKFGFDIKGPCGGNGWNND